MAKKRPTTPAKEPAKEQPTTPAKPQILPMSIKKSFSDIVKITVGSAQNTETFLLHRSLLTHHSEYFAKCLSGNWEEARRGNVTLDDIKPASFQMFSEWLFYGNKAFAEQLELQRSWHRQFAECDRASPSGKEARIALVAELMNQLRRLVDYYALGDRLVCASFKNSVMDQVVDQCVDSSSSILNRVSPCVVADAYKKTPEGSSLRQFLTDLSSHFGTSWIFEPDTRWPAEHVHAVGKKLLQFRDHGKDDAPSTSNLCERYHEHKEGEAACSEDRWIGI